MERRSISGPKRRDKDIRIDDYHRLHNGIIYDTTIPVNTFAGIDSISAERIHVAAQRHKAEAATRRVTVLMFFTNKGSRYGYGTWRYFVSDGREAQRFCERPTKYASALDGDDVVLSCQYRVRIRGDRRHGLTLMSRYYLFATEDTLNEFAANPLY